MLQLSRQTRSIVAEYSAQLATLFPNAPDFEFEGQRLIQLPHGIDETKLLRNLGYVELPSPIEEHYDFPSVDGKKAFGKQVHDLFEHDVRFARRITSKEWRRRPYLDRFGQWAVNRARYLL